MNMVKHTVICQIPRYSICFRTMPTKRKGDGSKSMTCSITCHIMSNNSDIRLLSLELLNYFKWLAFQKVLTKGIHFCITQSFKWSRDYLFEISGLHVWARLLSWPFIELLLDDIESIFPSPGKTYCTRAKFLHYYQVNLAFLLLLPRAIFLEHDSYSQILQIVTSTYYK